VSPGAAFAEDGARHARHCLRLAFANNPPDAIAEGIERLARAIRREARP